MHAEHAQTQEADNFAENGEQMKVMSQRLYRHGQLKRVRKELEVFLIGL